MCGPSIRFSLCSAYALIIIPTALNAYYFLPNCSVQIIAVNFITFSLLMYALIRTTFSDPGFIPKGEILPHEEIPKHSNIHTIVI